MRPRDGRRIFVQSKRSIPARAFCDCRSDREGDLEGKGKMGELHIDFYRGGRPVAHQELDVVWRSARKKGNVRGSWKPHKREDDNFSVLQAGVSRPPGNFVCRRVWLGDGGVARMGILPLRASGRSGHIGMHLWTCPRRNRTQAGSGARVYTVASPGGGYPNKPDVRPAPGPVYVAGAAGYGSADSNGTGVPAILAAEPGSNFSGRIRLDEPVRPDQGCSAGVLASAKDVFPGR